MMLAKPEVLMQNMAVIETFAVKSAE